MVVTVGGGKARGKEASEKHGGLSEGRSGARSQVYGAEVMVRKRTTRKTEKGQSNCIDCGAPGDTRKAGRVDFGKRE